MGEPLRIGLMGVGHWHAPMHANAVCSADAQIAAVWDQDIEIARNFGAAHDTPAMASIEDVMAVSDLVVVMGRPDGVPAIAEAVIDARRPMILEKPAATRTETLERLAEKAAATGLFVAVPLPNRLGPIVIEHERLVGLNRAGTVAHAHFRIVNGPPQRYRDDGVGWMLDPAVSGGGALRNLGIHGVDAALSLATGSLHLLEARIDNRIHQGAVEDYALLVLEDEQGAIFTVEAGYTFASMQPGGDFEWRIATANAYLLDNGDAAFAATLDDGVRRALPILPPAVRYDRFMADSLRRLASGDAPSVGLGDYLGAMRLIDQAYERGAS